MLERVWRFGRAVRAVTKAIAVQLQTIDPHSGWWPIGGWGPWWPAVRESFSGAWQQNQELRIQNILTYAPVYACVTLIARDVGKLRVKLVEQDDDGIWTETTNPAFSPVLRKPNRYQTRIEFYYWWVVSKLVHGNTYVWKQRDNRDVVVAMHILDPTRIKVLVSPDGSIFYALVPDNLAGLTEEDVTVAIPASEIIHDKMDPLYHPLCGVSPLSACALAALLALKIQNDSLNFFQNAAQPGGILTSPNFIQDDTAKRMKERWQASFAGDKAGEVAVLGDGLKFERLLRMSATDAQLIEQLNWTGLDVCTAFHMPAYKIGIGPPPNYNTIEGLNQQYYSDCLQKHIEDIELLLDWGLGIVRGGEPQELGTEFDIDDLLRMDTATRVKAASDAIGGAGMTINEARKKYFGLPAIAGGNTVFLQQQMWAVDVLAQRTAADLMPQAQATPPPDDEEPPDDEDQDFDDEDNGDEEDMDEDDVRDLRARFEKVLAA